VKLAELPQPPGKVPLRRNGNWRKRWRYLGAFSDELMVCAARVGVGPAGQTFWAVWDRERGELHERTRVTMPWLARGEVWTELAEGEHTGRIDWAPESGKALVRVEASAGKDEPEPVRAFLRSSGGVWAKAVCETGEDDNYVWTRKRPVEVECDVRIGERRIRCTARGVEDESCGYHPHHTVWDWSAGVGTTTDGRPVAWNLVSGVNDPPTGSERAIWVDGRPSEPGPATFHGLEAIEVDRARLDFTAEAERAKEENRFWAHYSYRQPFGTFTGTLPGGLQLAEAMGVMEHHDAHW
jgi:hypothetical protein